MATHLDSHVEKCKENKFCSLKSLQNESDVEQFFFAPLLKELGYTPDYQETKPNIQEVSIRKGNKKKGYKPDYKCYVDRQHLKPVLVIDVKHPDVVPEEGVSDAQLYTSIIRRNLHSPKPDQFCIGSNGLRTIVVHYEANTPEYDLDFCDFVDGNPKYEDFKREMGRNSRAKATAVSTEPFEFKRPDPKQIPSLFEKCHNLIWRREVGSPAFAFYEFSKLMFIKLNEDKKLHDDADVKKLIEAVLPLPPQKVYFSSHWISQSEHVDPSPINSMFRHLRDSLELEIIQKHKKRIFEANEELRLKPETIKAVVRNVEHLDLYGIDEDLNGRLFETFLSATMRGKELGQFFTPRTVVEFMSDLADLKVSKEHIDVVIDACCGTGGFLIEAMAKMTEKVRKNQSLSDPEKKKMVREIRDEHLFGIDAGKDPPIARIARINMYLHGDGGSKIFFADALDRQILIEETVTPEVRSEREELRKILLEEGTKFDVAITNPPFAMPYKRNERDQERILEQYSLAHTRADVRKLKASLKSNVMFIQRYHDLLKEHGRLVTIIDESVLNTDSDKDCRDFIYENFLIRAIISLPRMTFQRAGANVKTSILYLEKKGAKDAKEAKGEGQPHTFFARCENSGFDPKNMRKIDPSKSDLPEILQRFREFVKTGVLSD